MATCPVTVGSVAVSALPGWLVLFKSVKLVSVAAVIVGAT